MPQVLAFGGGFLSQPSDVRAELLAYPAGLGAGRFGVLVRLLPGGRGALGGSGGSLLGADAFGFVLAGRTPGRRFGVLGAVLRRGGRPEAHHRRDIVDAIRYLVDNGCKWHVIANMR
ncbi:transposase [Streptosporangium roseum]|uniref:transposase n=1 Tax=Streptosporangium roseum TaxID=2001 RepID=UPI0004CD4DBD|nr:transposase [Streptosporangium roseum]